ncbi:Zinc transporter ZIP1 [Amphibalanus amphitrite]|uniref:Zinc transporter ZIP1 n=1 Tax=Amphibalanus amphitrite TaxID=1232801 RepID=A0A6A4W617_AMPAM|nr:Zinc transporter ZIP1 [Amphibalanus amphitrite]
MADSVLITKIVVLVLFFTVTMLCGLLPVMLLRLARFGTKRFQTGRMGALLSALRRRGDLLVSCVMCLGAGVLLATIFTHMIAESREVFAEIEKAGLLPELDLPLSELFLCAGFFLVFFIEEMAHTFMKHGRRRKHRRAAAAAEAAEAGEKTNDDPHVVDIGGQHAFRAYLIVIALSVHSVFEGFAAAFEDSAREVWLFFAAIMAHKAIVSFCIGEQLLTAKRSKCFVITNLCIFSMATPLGVLLGLLVASPELQGGASLLATGILQGLAAGTILYVTFFELLGPEQHKPGSGLIKFFAMLLGFALMLVIHHSAGHSHSHGGHAHAVGAHEATDRPTSADLA